MSQTETLLLIGLGFSLAALLALFIGRLLWPFAMRLGARRMQRQVPSTVAELHTERDRLRAEYALLSQKLGARVESARASMAEQMAEVNRTRNRIETLVIDLNQRDATLAARDQEVAELRARIAELEAANAGSASMISVLRAETDEKSNEISALRESVADKEARITLFAPLPEISAETTETVIDPLVTEQRLKRRIDKLTAMSQQIATNRDQPADGAAPTTTDLNQQLENAALETEDLQKELARLDAAWTSKLGEIASKDSSSPGQSTPSQPPRGVANVISLAKRIKFLQGNTKS